MNRQNWLPAAFLALSLLLAATESVRSPLDSVLEDCQTGPVIISEG